MTKTICVADSSGNVARHAKRNMAERDCGHAALPPAPGEVLLGDAVKKNDRSDRRRP
eukprot:gene2836-4098_t